MKKKMMYLGSLICTITLLMGVNLNAYAQSGWLGVVQAISLNTTYKESWSATDYEEVLGGGSYGYSYDAFKFTKEMSGDVVVKITSKDFHYFTNHGTTFNIYKMADVNTPIAVLDIPSRLNSAKGKYISEDRVTLEEGEYYFVVQYDNNPISSQFHGGYKFMLKSK